MNNIEYREAITEVLDILDNTDKEDIEKIPEEFVEKLRQNASKDYKPNIDYSKTIDCMNLKQNTIDILAIICNKYWCNGIQNIEFINNLDYNEKILKEKYDLNNFFKNKTINEIEEKSLTIQNKTNIINKIITNITSIFKHN